MWIVEYGVKRGGETLTTSGTMIRERVREFRERASQVRGLGWYKSKGKRGQSQG